MNQKSNNTEILATILELLKQITPVTESDGNEFVLVMRTNNQMVVACMGSHTGLAALLCTAADQDNKISDVIKLSAIGLAGKIHPLKAMLVGEVLEFGNDTKQRITEEDRKRQSTPCNCPACIAKREQRKEKVKSDPNIN